MNTQLSYRPRLIWLLLISLFLCVGYEDSAWALNEYYSISRSIRSLGMGGAFYGLSDDEHALFYNPAGLSRYAGGSQFKLQVQGDMATQVPGAISAFTNTTSHNLNDIVNSFIKYQGTPLFVDATPLFAYYLHKHFAFGLLVGDTKVDLAMLGRDLDSSVDLTAISDSGFFIGYADEFFPHLHIGVNAKAVFRAGGNKTFNILDIVQNSKLLNDVSDLGGAGNGIDFDLGATYELPDLPFAQESVSLVMNNLLATRYTLTQAVGTPPGLPRLLTLAGQVRTPGVWWFKHFDWLLDLAEFEVGGQTNDNFGARYGAVWKHVNFGVEAPIGWFYLRAGVHQGNLTAGLGVDARFLRLDLATYAEEDFLNPGELTSRRVALSLAFGWGGSAPEVAPQTQPAAPEKPDQSAPVAPGTVPPPTATPPTGEPTPPPSPSPTPPVPEPTAVPTPAPSATPSAADSQSRVRPLGTPKRFDLQQ